MNRRSGRGQRVDSVNGRRMRALRRGLAALVAAAFALAGTPVLAQGGPQGIGYAQAEEGTWFCRAGDPVTALNCARDQCRAQAGGQDCYRTAWCFPAGWAGVVTVWTADFHSNRPLCGAPSLPALLDAMRALCSEAPEATACDAGLVTDPAGAAVELALHWTPQRSPCDADRAAFMIGQLGTDKQIELGRLAAGAAIARPVRPGQPVTMDLRLDRLTIDIDAGGIVTGARCG